MEKVPDYQQKQLEAIHLLYKNLIKKSKNKLSLNEVIISWFTDGYAERFRSEYLENNPIYS